MPSILLFADGVTADGSRLDQVLVRDPPHMTGANVPKVISPCHLAKSGHSDFSGGAGTATVLLQMDELVTTGWKGRTRWATNRP